MKDKTDAFIISWLITSIRKKMGERERERGKRKKAETLIVEYVAERALVLKNT